jgi:hypothetical protein
VDAESRGAIAELMPDEFAANENTVSSCVKCVIRTLELLAETVSAPSTSLDDRLILSHSLVLWETPAQPSPQRGRHHLASSDLKENNRLEMTLYFSLYRAMLWSFVSGHL